MQNLEDAYNQAKEDREAVAQEIKDKANIDVEPFDPAEGPPSLPEEETATDGGDAAGSTTTDEGNTTGEEGSTTTEEGNTAGDQGTTPPWATSQWDALNLYKELELHLYFNICW